MARLLVEIIRRIIKFSLPHVCIAGFNTNALYSGYFHEQLVSIIAQPSRQQGRLRLLVDFHQLIDLDEGATFANWGLADDKQLKFVDFILDELEHHATSSKITNAGLSAFYINYPFLFSNANQAQRAESAQHCIARICLANARTITNFGFFFCNYQPNLVQAVLDKHYWKYPYNSEPSLRFEQPSADVCSLEGMFQCIAALHCVVSLHVTSVYDRVDREVVRSCGSLRVLRLPAIADDKWRALQMEYNASDTSSNDQQQPFSSKTSTNSSHSVLRCIQFYDVENDKPDKFPKLCNLLLQATNNNTTTTSLEQVKLIVFGFVHLRCRRDALNFTIYRPELHQNFVGDAFPNALQVHRSTVYTVGCRKYDRSFCSADAIPNLLQDGFQQALQVHEQQTSALVTVLAAPDFLACSSTMLRQPTLNILFRNEVLQKIEKASEKNENFESLVTSLRTLLSFVKRTKGARLRCPVDKYSDWKRMRLLLHCWTSTTDTCTGAVRNARTIAGGGVLQINFVYEDLRGSRCRCDEHYLFCARYDRYSVDREMNAECGRVRLGCGWMGGYLFAPLQPPLEQLATPAASNFLPMSDKARRGGDWLTYEGLNDKREFRPIIAALGWNRRVLLNNGVFGWRSTSADDVNNNDRNLADAYGDHQAAARCSNNQIQLLFASPPPHYRVQL